MKKNLLQIRIILILVCGLFSINAAAATFTVNQPDDAGDGVCDATCTLRDAIDTANNSATDDAIIFDPSVSNITLTGFHLQIMNANGALDINGPGADKLTIDGGGFSRLFYIENSTVRIAGLTLTGGNPGPSDSGGAIFAQGSITLERVFINGNTAGANGGGVFFDTGNHRIRNSTISGNTAGAVGGGGGFMNSSATVNVVNSTISANTAGFGGGFSNLFSTSTTELRNVTITGNATTTGAGGGGFWNQGTVNFGNSIVAGNSGAFSSPPEIYNTGTTTSVDFNLVGDSAGDAQFTFDPIAYQPADILNIPPLLIALGNYGGSVPTHPLQFGSAAIDAGDDMLAVDPFDNSPLPFDQRGTGFLRSTDSAVDIGAFEVQDVRYYVTQAADAPEGGACDDNCALREAAWLIITSGSQSGTIDFARVFTSSTPIDLSFGSGIGFGTANVTVAGYDARNVVIQGRTLGIFFINGNVKISDVMIFNGIAPPGDGGGGIVVNGGSLTLERVSVNANATSFSGGAGGGVSIEGGTDHRIIDSTFYFNQAPVSGCGGLIHSAGTLAIANSTFSGNSANATFGGGGAICVTGGAATLRNVTISGNTASTGGGIHQTGGTIDIANSIVAGNSASGSNPPEINYVAGTFISSGNNLIGDSAGDAANTGNPIAWQAVDYLDAPPMLGPLQDNGGPTQTMELLSGSIAINSGGNALAVDPFNNLLLTLDQRGFTRIVGANVDIGAFEFGTSSPPPPPTPTPTPTVTPTPTPTPTPVAGIPKIAFASRRLASTFDVFVMDADGGNQTRLTNSFQDDFEPAWSPDGSKIAFSTKRDGNFEIYVMNADGTNQTRVTFYPGLDLAPSWSPDGTMIAFTREPSLLSNNKQIMVMYANGSGVTVLTPVDPVFGGQNEEPSWSPDGTKIAYANGFGENQKEIYVVNSDGSNGASPVRLTNNAVRDDFPDWSPDGTRIAFGTRRDGGNWEIYSMNADGTTPLRLTNDPATEILPSWSADGSQIIFTTDRTGDTEIFRMNADGSNPTNLSNISDADSMSDWQPGIAWSSATPTGSNVAVQMGTVSVTFGGVSQAGTTSQYSIAPASAGPVPMGFTFGPGLPAYEITTNAVYTPPVTVCIQVPSVTTAVAFAALYLFHFENGALRDRTSLRDFATKTICAEVTSLSPFVVAQQVAPTAAKVSVSGQVRTADGRGIRNVWMTITNFNGETRTTLTSTFGYFRFFEIEAGQTYIITVQIKRYQFPISSQVISVGDEITGIEFTAMP
ncbi:MAG: choice-of-anchor Q domain-containing protein [Pyrinomonadaceae bacterium]